METTKGALFKVYAVLGPAAFLSPAPFGRFHQQSAWNVDGRIAWVLQESIGFLTFAYQLSQTDKLHDLKLEQIVASLMFFGHYINRSLIWPLCMMHSISPSHPIVILSAAAWQYLNGSLQAIAVHRMTFPDAFTAVLGIFVFSAGMVSNILHDKMLADLRKVKAGYSIPQGYLYNYISFPNYLCEWFEWTGYAIWLRQPEGWWFVFLEIMVMLPRAISGHHWYKSKFGNDFPKSRKAIIPFLL